MKIKNLLFAFVTLFYNCNTSEKKINENQIIGSWELSEVRAFDKHNSEIDELTKSKLGSDILSKGLSLYFYPDSSYSEIEGSKIKHGKWHSLNEKEIEYGNHKLRVEKFDQEESNKSLLVSISNTDNNIESELTLIEELEKLEDYKKDPFHSSNNKWRQKAQKKETNEEIIDRLSNYVLHNAYLLKAAHERNTGSVSFIHSRGLIRIYQGAIGIVKESKINKSWINSYYDKEDAMKAYYLYKSYLGKDGVYKAKSTGDWVKDDYEILLKLYSKIQKTKTDEIERFAK